MKISIELEIAPEEVALATELLNTLRQLTEHAKGPPPLVVNTRQLFETLIARLNDPAQAENAPQEIFKILTDDSYGTTEKLTEDLIEAISAVALSYATVAQSGVAPYMSFLPDLPEPFKASVRDKVIGKVLKHVAKPRPINADRTEFFAHAEAFAVLVKLQLGVSIDGAVQTIERLLNKSDTRSAAITMLGKTVELCHQQLLQASPKHLSSLQKVLAGVTESAFVYDIDYISQSLGWTAQAPDGPAAAAGAAGPPAPSTSPEVAPPHQYTGLQQVTSFPALSNTIFALCYNPTNMELAAGGREDNITVYNQQGEIAHRAAIPYDNMVCAMDHHPRHNLLAMCGVTAEASATSMPSITLYDAANNYRERLIIPKPQGTILTSIRCFGPDSDYFVTGESSSPPTPGGELLCIYDLNRATASQPLPPILTFSDHTDLITCLATTPSTPTLFASGSRDRSVKLWDLRMSGPAASLSSPTSGGGAHQGMVTSIDMVDHFVASTGQDCALCLWDVRMEGLPMVSGVSVDGTCLLRVAMKGAPAANLAAVASVGGLFLVDFTNAAAPVTVPASVPGGMKPYHDIRWAAGQPLLYAAGETMQIDLFQAI